MPYGYADSESGAIRYPTLSSLLSTAPQPGMRGTASDAPGSMLFEAGGKWGGVIGRIAGYTALSQLSITNLALSVCADMTNPLTECGRTRMYPVSQGVWRPVPGQCLVRLANSDGSPLLDLAGSAPMVGNYVEVFATSEPLPAWIHSAGDIRRFAAFAGINDTAGSTAVSELSVGISTAAHPDANALLVVSTAMAAQPKGVGDIRRRYLCLSSGLFIGSFGGNVSSGGMIATTNIGGGFGVGAKIRATAKMGAATNRIRIWSVEVWS